MMFALAPFLVPGEQDEAVQGSVFCDVSGLDGGGDTTSRVVA